MKGTGPQLGQSSSLLHGIHIVSKGTVYTHVLLIARSIFHPILWLQEFVSPVAMYIDRVHNPCKSNNIVVPLLFFRVVPSVLCSAWKKKKRHRWRADGMSIAYYVFHHHSPHTTLLTIRYVIERELLYSCSGRDFLPAHLSALRFTSTAIRERYISILF